MPTNVAVVVCTCFQFTKDFVNDCRDLLYAFFLDPFRLPRLADRLEEDLVHHASVFNRRNACNVAFKLNSHDLSKSDLSSSFIITGTSNSRTFVSFC